MGGYEPTLSLTINLREGRAKSLYDVDMGRGYGIRGSHERTEGGDLPRGGRKPPYGRGARRLLRAEDVGRLSGEGA